MGYLCEILSFWLLYRCTSTVRELDNDVYLPPLELIGHLTELDQNCIVHKFNEQDKPSRDNSQDALQAPLVDFSDYQEGRRRVNLKIVCL